MTNSISIIVPCYNEEKYIASCIESIVTAEIDVQNSEVIFVDGNSQDQTVAIIESYQERYPFIKVVPNPQRFTPMSMNIGIQASNGAYIFILSAHAKYAPDYFRQLVDYARQLQADCVGGVLHTDVKNQNRRSNAIKKVLTHRFGVGNASFRTGSREIKAVDTVAFGCYSREAFQKYGLFNEKLIRNQDIELNKRILNGGGKIYLIPEVEATYFARENFTDLAKNNYGNGLWNLLTAYYTKTLSSLSLRHFIPLLFVLSLLLPSLFALFIPELWWITFLSLGSYLALVIIISLNLRDKKTDFFYLMTSFLVLHLSYGFGSLVGLLSVVKKIVKGEK